MKLRIEHLKKAFGNHVVLEDVDFEFESGHIYALLGRNGAGKTTLFNCLNEDLPSDGGAAYLETDGAERKLSNEDIGYVLSTPIVPEFLTGREFLQFFLDIHGSQIPDPQPTDVYFDRMHIEEVSRDKLLKGYSHGMKNKMQMLINMIAEPKVLLLDEPLTSLDVVVAEEIKDILRNYKKDRILILSTHILDLALDLCDEIVLLNHGRLEGIERRDLDNQDLRDKIIEALRDAEDYD